MQATVRWTIGSALAWGLLFTVMAFSRALGAGAEPSAVAVPILAFGVIGLTVGGLVGPLLRGIWLRRAATRSRGGEE